MMKNKNQNKAKVNNPKAQNYVKEKSNLDEILKDPKNKSQKQEKNDKKVKIVDLGESEKFKKLILNEEQNEEVKEKPTNMEENNKTTAPKNIVESFNKFKKPEFVKNVNDEKNQNLPGQSEVNENQESSSNTIKENNIERLIYDVSYEPY